MEDGSTHEEENVKLFNTDQELLRYLCVTFVMIAFWSCCAWIPFFPFPDVFFAALISFILHNPKWSDMLYTSVLEPLAVSQESNVVAVETTMRAVFSQLKNRAQEAVVQYKVPLNQFCSNAIPWLLSQMNTATTTATTKLRVWPKRAAKK
jgi:hypothetical protein